MTYHDVVIVKSRARNPSCHCEAAPFPVDNAIVTKYGNVTVASEFADFDIENFETFGQVSVQFSLNARLGAGLCRHRTRRHSTFSKLINRKKTSS
jgi:hypothetical protein